MIEEMNFSYMRKALHSETACPFYIQLAALLEEAIKNKSFPNGFLPAERQLAKNLNISRVTVSKSLSLLERKNLISRQQGVGTRIIFEQDSLVNNVEFKSSLNSLYKVATTQYLLKKRIKGDDKMVKYLDLPLASELAYLKLLRLTNGLPICLEHNYSPIKFLPNPELFEGSLYEYWLEKGFQVTKQYNGLEAIACDTESAVFLNIPLESTVLKMTEVTLNQFSEVLHISIAIIISDFYSHEFAC